MQFCLGIVAAGCWQSRPVFASRQRWDSSVTCSAITSSWLPDQKVTQLCTRVHCRVSGCVADQWHGVAGSLVRASHHTWHTSVVYQKHCQGRKCCKDLQHLHSCFPAKLIARFAGTEFPGWWSSDLASQGYTFPTGAVYKAATAVIGENLSKQPWCSGIKQHTMHQDMHESPKA